MNDLREQERPEQANRDKEQTDNRQDEWILERLVLAAEWPGSSSEHILCRPGHGTGSADEAIRSPVDAPAPTAAAGALRVIVGSGG
ncbi:MAG TPA: hypothetical protein VFT76_02350 [Actinomycetota bacterium]|nr:hypothetical protein [Actinomycetota bacterium]